MSSPRGKVTSKACLLGAVASIGGFIFGYVSGQISGFFMMNDFAQRFGIPGADGTYHFSAIRQGTIVGFVCVGALIGSLAAGRLAEVLGRRLAISLSAFFACVGTAVEVSSSSHWEQFAVGRLATGLSIGALSVIVPMYQSESVPASIRGVVVSSYQLLITLGILTSEIVNWVTESNASSASWRIPNSLTFGWALALGVGMLFLPESPRYACSRGRVDEARRTIGSLCGEPVSSAEVAGQIADIQDQLDEESKSAAGFRWTEIVTAPRMLYRTVLAVVLMAGQQLTGINFFFYFGTTLFASTGISNSYTTMIILGAVNVLFTIAGLWIVQRYGRRAILMTGAAWMTVCFLVYAFVGHYALDRTNPAATPKAGQLLIVFSCLAIAAFAVSWGPLAWAVNAELFPLRYRGTCMGLATAANWLWNFLISFFTRFIIDEIDYFYGLVFAGCCAALVAVVFFFVIESKDRTLEEIDGMYVDGVNPIKSAGWRREDGVSHARKGSGQEGLLI